MVRHIHYKDGWYAVWSTIIDDYITEWTKNQQEIIDFFVQEAVDKAKDNAMFGMREARKHGCNAIHCLRCDPSTFMVVSKESQVTEHDTKDTRNTTTTEKSE